MSDGMNECSKKQIGGDHYLRMKLQPWDIIDAHGLDFYEGTALAYLLRWKDKGGIQDLEKCVHTLERLIAREKGPLYEKNIEAFEDQDIGLVERKGMEVVKRVYPKIPCGSLRKI